ncbi:MAG TPA: glycosyltransferase family 39 protein [Vicinamibacteria bacterium]|nr:glycosyltransferase family 39 protein [Vicinamibacteria bacterium]
MRPSRAIPLALLLAIAVRLPFWIEALRTPVDGDTAIVGLMARHPGVGSTLWGQPYGSPLDSWVALPFVAVWGYSVEALRVPCFFLSLLLVPLAYALARELHERAALPAAVLVACPPPYFLLLAALPPPFYPTTLALCGVILLLAARAGRRLADAEAPPPRGTLLLLGISSGLALWTHLMSASAVAAAGAWVLFRSRGKRRLLAWGLVPFVAASAPLWSRALRDDEATRIVRVSARNESSLDHLAATLEHLHEPVGGVLGTHVPVVADDADLVLHAPGWAAGLTVLLYGFLLVLAGRAATRRHVASLYLLAAGLALLAFPLPLRAAPHTIRFLTPLYLPVAALVAWSAAPRGTSRRAWVAVLALATLHLGLGLQLLETWRRTDRAALPFLLEDLRPVRRLLEAEGVRRVYASYGTAFRLTWESGERIVASPPWNDRFRHWPLPLLDEVRFAKNVAWVLTPAVPSGLPTPEEFELAMRRLGGRWRRDVAGPAIVFHAFVPPFAPDAVPWPGAGPAGDADLRTCVEPDPTAPFELRLAAPRPLEAVTLLSALDGPRLPRSADIQVSADGRSFETVASRRRREERLDLRWVNGHPQAIIDHDVFAIPLGGRPVAALRIVPVESGERWRVGEILLHDVAGRSAWDEWLDPGLDWEARRRALVEKPLPGREDWYSRVLLAARHRSPP